MEPWIDPTDDDKTEVEEKSVPLMTTDPEKRIEDHFSGAGSQVTREVPPISVNSLNANRSVQSAKRAEALVYSAMRDYHGADMVRGAGHTARFSLQ